MTNVTKRIMIAAATLVVAAGAASAQSLKAEIPFSFRAGNTVLAPGTYQVNALLGTTGTPIFRIRSLKQAVALMPAVGHDAKKSWVQDGTPLLEFECMSSGCSLAEIWMGDFAPAYKLPQGKMSKDEPVRVALIALRPDSE